MSERYLIGLLLQEIPGPVFVTWNGIVEAICPIAVRRG